MPDSAAAMLFEQLPDNTACSTRLCTALSAHAVPSSPLTLNTQHNIQCSQHPASPKSQSQPTILSDWARIQ